MPECETRSQEPKCCGLVWSVLKEIRISNYGGNSEEVLNIKTDDLSAQLTST